MKWALCLRALHNAWHAVDERRDHPDGLEAECGHLLLPRAVLHDEPSGPPCEDCAALQLARGAHV